MPIQPNDPYVRGPIGSAIIDAIDRVADRLIRVQILVTACDTGEIASVPEQVDDARHFVEHALHMALTVYLGPSTARRVTDELLERIKPTPPQAYYQEDPQTAAFRRSLPAAQKRLPVILVSTPDRGSLQRLAMRLVGRARVTSMRNVDRIGEIIRRHGAENTILVLDGCLPNFDPTAVVRALERLKTAPTIVVWGGGPEIRKTLRSSIAQTRIAHAPFDATDRDVGDLIGSLLG